MEAPNIRLIHLRPGRDALAWLRRTIDGLKSDDPLRAVTVLVPNAYAGQQIRMSLGDTGYINLHTLLLSSAAHEIARPVLRADSVLLDPVLEESAVRASVAAQTDAFRSVDHPSLHSALVDLFRLLRRLEPDRQTLEAAATSRTARGALAAYESFRLGTEPFLDPTRLAVLATERLASATAMPPELERLGALVLYLPTRFDPADARFLAAATRWVPLHAAFGHVGDPESRRDDRAGLGDQAGEDAARLLASALGVPPPERPAIGRLFVSARIVRTPDPGEEVREALRTIAADLAAGVPLHRMALLYRQTDQYAGLVRDALVAAGLPWVSSEGRRLHESRPGRALLGLLRLDERRFAREALMEWLETEPRFDSAISALGPGLWNRLSRLANVVRGAEQWRGRLNALAAELEEDARRRESEGQPDERVEAPRAQARAARAIADFVSGLHDALRPPRRAGRWFDYVDWAKDLATRYIGSPAAWSGSEQRFAHEVFRALEDLRRADQTSHMGAIPPTPETFVAALASVLNTRAVPVGQLGVGVFVGPVAAVTGLVFDRVHLLGMVESAYPPPPPVDPFFAVDRDPLERRERHRRAERQAFLTALATGDDGEVVLHVPGTSGTRGAFPSRWALEIATSLEGRMLDATGFLGLDPRLRSWLRVVGSARDGVRRATAPADLEDRRLAQVAEWIGHGRRLRDHPIANRQGLALGPALTMLDRRLSNDFTEFDGNVAPAAAGPSVRRIFSGRPIAATAVETWAKCPFKYFLASVLAVEPTARPEDAWTINPLERGSLVHNMLEEFFGDLLGRGRLQNGEPYTADDHALLGRLATEHFARVEARGITGHPLAWENARASVLADLRAFLATTRSGAGRRGSAHAWSSRRLAMGGDRGRGRRFGSPPTD